MSTSALVVIGIAVALGAFAKGVTGMGLPLVAIPVMAVFLGVEEAVVIMAIPGVITNSWLIWEHRRSVRETRDLPAFVGSGVVGAAGGTWLLVSLDERLLALLLAVLVLLYVVRALTRPDFRLSPEVSRYLSPAVGFGSGVLQGATGASAPLVATYLHSFRLARAAYVFSITLTFQVLALVQVITLAGFGFYDRRRLLASLVALIPIAIAFPLGIRLSRRISHRAFELAVLVVLGLSAVRLTMTALGV